MVTKIALEKYDGMRDKENTIVTAIDTVNILDINIAAMKMAAAIKLFQANIIDLNGQYVCFLNVHTAITAYTDAAYKEAIHAGSIIFPDGRPVAREVAKRAKVPAEKISGPDFFAKIMELSEENNWSHYFYGAAPETLAAMQKKLLSQYPQLQIRGACSPPYRKLTADEEAADIEGIKSADADFIWIGLGAPKQEYWMHAHKGMFRGVMLGVGAAFDFTAGSVKRAPRWMQKTSLEWLYRLTQDPARLWKRYLKTNIRFLFLKLRHKL
jgi:N-acetylglucosaminyldiphosphoundecaprenol N-acetyl-beta-D-mannosaminyltransferase